MSAVPQFDIGQCLHTPRAAAAPELSVALGQCVEIQFVICNLDKYDLPFRHMSKLDKYNLQCLQTPKAAEAAE